MKGMMQAGTGQRKAGDSMTDQLEISVEAAATIRRKTR